MPLPLGKRLVAMLAGALIGIAGLLKAIDPGDGILALVGVGVSRSLAGFTILAISGIEIGLGVRLLVGRQVVNALYASAVLIAGFTVYLVAIWITNPSAECGCFGALDQWWATGSPGAGVLRNLLLIGALLWCARSTTHATIPLGSSAKLGCHLTILIAPVLVASSARGQWAMPDERPWSMEVSRAALDRLIIIADLDPEQQSLVDAIYRDFESGFREWVQSQRTNEQAIKNRFENERHGSLEYHVGNLEWQRFISECAEQQEARNGAAIEALMAVMRDDQQDGWRRWRQWNTRRNLVPAGILSEERIDVLDLLEVLKITPQQSRDPDQFVILVNEYERLLNEALLARRAWMVGEMRHQWKRIAEHSRTDGSSVWVQGLHGGAGEWDRRIKEQYEHHQRIRVLNRNYLLMITEMLSADDAQALRERYDGRRTLWLQHQADHALRYLDLLLNEVSINDDQRAALETLRQNHVHAVKQLHLAITNASDDRVEAMLSVRDPAAKMNRMDASQRRMDDLMVQRRREINATCELAFRSLTQSQQEQYPLPAPLK